MKNKSRYYFQAILCYMLIITFIVGSDITIVSAKSKQYSAEALEVVINGVLEFKQKQTKAGSVQELINNELTENAGKGSAEWLVIAMSQYKDEYDYNSYIKSLNSYINKNKSIKATDLQRIALAFSATRSKDEFVQTTINKSIGKLGVMSYIYGLILLDSRADQSESLKRDEIVDLILSLVQKDGGWSLGGKASDVDITAMAIQALAPYYAQDEVKSAVDKALDLLSKLQLKTGDFTSWGTRSSESGAQVITALSALNIDCQKDKRFIKNNNTLIDGLMLYSNSDGGFSHVFEGKSDNTASVQAMYSLVAYWRFLKGQDIFYNFTKDENAGAEGKNVVNKDLTTDPSKEKGRNELSNMVKKEDEKGFHTGGNVILPALSIIGVLILACIYFTLRVRAKRT